MIASISPSMTCSPVVEATMLGRWARSAK